MLGRGLVLSLSQIRPQTICVGYLQGFIEELEAIYICMFVSVIADSVRQRAAKHL